MFIWFSSAPFASKWIEILCKHELKYQAIDIEYFIDMMVNFHIFRHVENSGFLLLDYSVACNIREHIPPGKGKSDLEALIMNIFILNKYIPETENIFIHRHLYYFKELNQFQSTESKNQTWEKCAEATLKHFDDSDLSLKVALEALELIEPTSDDLLLGRIHKTLGCVYRIRKDTTKAIVHLTLSINYLKTTPLLLSQIMNHLGDCYIEIKNYKQALEVFQEALGSCQQNSSDMSTTLALIAKTHFLKKIMVKLFII
ncbi:hypothetical protein DLAC_10784 [Tieghemostelium lacteum]|uniref:Uncharacterized protein n=1 Tax=Tieghemostelium lacteum TaxID=361077 RepID=A0A151Z454_TIELA|nr:hypothetical protein DLAC_10784 [Tieghemostelium lacteum]|eukprot:KYQ88753.1 hypothetical protein DLAC_10784 [Tieghemostelium lacteum]